MIGRSHPKSVDASASGLSMYHSFKHREITRATLPALCGRYLAGKLQSRRESRSRLPAGMTQSRFSRSRKRYERQGILVEIAAIEKAERECAEDAGERAAARVRETERRREEDRNLLWFE